MGGPILGTIGGNMIFQEKHGDFSKRLSVALVLMAAMAGPALRAAVCFAQPTQAQPDPTSQDPSPADAQPPDESGEPANTSEPVEQAARALDLSSPRATLREFLLAVQESSGDHPERIDDAVRCLDTSQIDDEDAVERARLLARRLHAIIEKKGVKLADIPEETQDDTYVLYQARATAETAGASIRLARNAATGHWRFTADTLDAIPTLEQAVQKQAEAQAPAPVESSVPAARRSARATFATFLKAMNAEPQNLDAAVACLDPTDQDPQAWSVRGKDLAHKLKNVMDKIKVWVAADTPDDPDGDPYVWYTSDAGNIVVARIEEGPHKGEWRFTPMTLKTLDELYAEFEQKDMAADVKKSGVKEKLSLGLRLQKMMPAPLRHVFLRLELWQWLGLAMLLAVGWLIKTVVAVFVMLLLRFWLGRRRIEIDLDVQRRAVRSSGAVATVYFWWHAVEVNYLLLPASLVAVLLPVTKFGLAATIVWVGYRLVDVLGGHIAGSKSVQLTSVDDLLIPLLRKILRVVVVLIVVLFALDYWLEKPPTTVLGALGVGGVALAFAAQDTLGNFFGSITVLFDRPFGLGDWIVVGDVEGTVERVGFRSTRVRTFYNSVISIPNSKMVNTQVDNYGARRYRRAKIMLSLTYDTPPEKIGAFCEGVRELIRLHPYTRKDYYHVYFNQFADSSLDVLVYLFFEVPDWGTELRERHHLFLDILKLARQLGVSFAFPTRTVWLERTRGDVTPTPEQTGGEGAVDPDSVGLDHAVRVFEESYGPEPPRRPPVVIDTLPRSKTRASGHT